LDEDDGKAAWTTGSPFFRDIFRDLEALPSIHFSVYYKGYNPETTKWKRSMGHSVEEDVVQSFCHLLWIQPSWNTLQKPGGL
jgi:hypothetical protein